LSEVGMTFCARRK